MKNLTCITVFLVFCSRLFSQPEPVSSPYFMVTGSDKNIDALPLKSTHVNVNISGVIADVIIEQTYTNEGTKPLEAIYVFPGSTNSAVYAMQMQVGNRIIEAKIEEKEKALVIYNEAKQEGKRASLLTQFRPNVFQMNVANILPHDTIKVRLQYTELLIPDEGIYQFVYPTVVGPRYINGTEQADASFAASPYQHAGDPPLSEFKIQLHISTGVPLNNVYSKTHLLAVNQQSASTADITIIPMENDGNHDFVLNYTVKGKTLQSGVLLYDDGDEKYFLCMVQPPKQIETNAIPPREYIFIVDVSGSMHGFPLDVSKALLNNLISGLRPEDRFNVLLFSGGNQVLAPSSIQANAANIQLALNFIDNQDGAGGTELMNALKEGLALPKNEEGASRSVIVVTDGYVGVEVEAFEYIRQHLDEANLFAFGIGSSVNRFLIEGMAHAGQGQPWIIEDQAKASTSAEKFRQYIANPVLTQVKAKFNDFDAYDIEPLTIPDIFSDRPVIVFGKYHGKPKGTIEITGFTGDHQHANTSFGSINTGNKKSRKTSLIVDLDGMSADPKHSALKFLWAREKLRRISDYENVRHDDKAVQEITDLGLTYHLLTAYTSFVAVEDNPVREANDSLVSVHQPLPTPENVSNYAVGFSLDITGYSGIINHSTFGWFIALIAVLLCCTILTGEVIRNYHKGTLLLMFVVVGLNSCIDDNKEIQCPDKGDYSAARKITFILGADDDLKNPYYQQASLYFKQQSQDGTQVVVNNIRSLESLYEFLKKDIPDQGAWEEINLVVHGNRWTGIALGIDDKEKIRTNAASLQQALTGHQYPAMSPDIIDDKTRIHIYGCSVGLDTALLNEFSILFTNDIGQKAQVEASPYFNIFYTPTDQPGKAEHLDAECYYITYPIERIPSVKELSIALQHKYADKCIEWEAALQRPYLNALKEPYAYQFHVPVNWTFFYQKSDDRPVFKWQDQIRKWVGDQPEISATLKEMELKPEQFWWTAKPIEFKISPFQTQPAIGVKGSTRVYCVLVPIN